MLVKLKKLFKREEQARETRRALFDLFSSEDGQIVLAYLARRYYVFSSTLGETTEETAFNEGARSVIISLIKTINTDPQKVEKFFEDQSGQSKEF